MVQALLRLLRTRSYEEVRQRMYDSPPGSAWWSACKIELDFRNSEQMSISSLDTARWLEKMRSSTEMLHTSTAKFLQATDDMTELLKSTRASGRRIEVATYLVIAVTILQLFYLIFQFFGKR